MNTKVLKLKRLVEDLEIEMYKDYTYPDYIVENIIDEAKTFINN